METVSMYIDEFFTLVSNEDIVIILLAATVLNFIIALLAFRYPRSRRYESNKPAVIAPESHDAFNAIQEQIQSIEQKLQQSQNRVSTLEQSSQKTAIIRFNPFRDSGVGGNQSFALAHINNNGDGFIITHLFSREMSRVSSKKILAWKSELELSPEEQDAIDQIKNS